MWDEGESETFLIKGQLCRLAGYIVYDMRCSVRSLCLFEVVNAMRHGSHPGRPDFNLWYASAKPGSSDRSEREAPVFPAILPRRLPLHVCLISF